MPSAPNPIRIYKKGEAILTEPAIAVTEDEFGTKKLEDIANRLKAIQAEIGAVGFAAPQIGAAKCLMIIGMEFKNPRRPNVKIFPNMLFVNPELVSVSIEMDDDWEGCASIDKTIALVDRAIHITYKARDIHGNHISGDLSNFQARAFQHELDHLNGVLMTEKAKEIKEVDPSIKIISFKS